MKNDWSSSPKHNDHKFHTQDSIEWIICFVTMLNLHRAHLHFTSKFFYPRLYSGHFRLQQEKRLGKKIRDCSFPCALVSVPCWTVCEKLLPDDKTIGKTKTTARVYFGVFRFPFCSVDEFSVFPFFFPLWNSSLSLSYYSLQTLTSVLRQTKSTAAVFFFFLFFILPISGHIFFSICFSALCHLLSILSKQTQESVALIFEL